MNNQNSIGILKMKFIFSGRGFRLSLFQKPLNSKIAKKGPLGREEERDLASALPYLAHMVAARIICS
jgi:hypothetical protein